MTPLHNVPCAFYLQVYHTYFKIKVSPTLTFLFSRVFTCINCRKEGLQAHELQKRRIISGGSWRVASSDRWQVLRSPNGVTNSQVELGLEREEKGCLDLRWGGKSQRQYFGDYEYARQENLFFFFLGVLTRKKNMCTSKKTCDKFSILLRFGLFTSAWAYS